MEKGVFVFLILIVLAACPGLMARKGKHDILKLLCWPNDTVRAECFSKVPTGEISSKNWLAWLLPTPEDDTYVINGQETFDPDEFSVSSIEHNPRYLCQHKDGFVEGLQCMDNATLTLCPWLPAKLIGKSKKMSAGINYICSRIDELDPVCLSLHWRSMKSCRKEIKQGLIPPDPKQKGPGYKPSRPQPLNATTAVNGTANATTLWQKLDKSFCYHKYLILQCVIKSVSSCHARTAELMYAFSKNSSSSSCQQQMNDWEAAHIDQHVSDCHDSHCSGIASSLASVTLATVLLSVLGVLRVMV